MDIKLEKYYSFITNRIIQENGCGIDKIISIKSKGTFAFSNETMEKITSALKSNKQLPLDNHTSEQNGFRQYLDVFDIKDGNGKEFYVLVYDNDELSQDPTILKILKCE